MRITFHHHPEGMEIIQPRVGRNDLPWDNRSVCLYPEGGCISALKPHAAIVKHAPSPLGLCPAASVQPQRGFTYQPSGCDAPPFCVATLGQPSSRIPQP